MRSVLFHCRKYGVKIGQLANRPQNIVPEEITTKEQSCQDCVVVFITVEKNDDIERVVAGLSFEIAKMCQDVGCEKVVILPFAHLSNNLAPSKEGREAITLIAETLKKKFEVIKIHFGSHKELLIDVYGHPGNVRYREF